MENRQELYAPNIERGLISSVIFEPEILDEINGILSSDDFFVPNYRNVFEIILELNKEEKPIDDSFIISKLKSKTNDAENILIEIMASTPISSVKGYAQEIKELSQKRKLYNVSIEIRKQLQDDTDSIGLIEKIANSINDIQASVKTSSGSRNIGEIIQEIEDDMERARLNEKIPSILTGYNNFDSYIGGFVENGLTVVAARPSMGKSSFTSGPIVGAIDRGEAVILYSMEVVDKNALSRLLSFRSQEPLSSIKIGTVRDFNGFLSAKEFFNGANNIFSIVDRSGMTMRELEMDIVRRIKGDKNLRIIMIDHLLQLAIDPGKHAPTELGNITKMLKRIAQNYKVSIVLLSQLNRSVESRDNKRPMMADLQGSGSIEQDADMIVFLYRPEYYKEKEWDSEKDGAYQRLEVENAEVIVGKNRDGPTGSVEIGFKSSTVSFINDTGLLETVEYIYEEEDFEEKAHTETSVKEKDDIIQSENEHDQVTMPLI